MCKHKDSTFTIKIWCTFKEHAAACLFVGVRKFIYPQQILPLRRLDKKMKRRSSRTPSCFCQLTFFCRPNIPHKISPWTSPTSFTHLNNNANITKHIPSWNTWIWIIDAQKAPQRSERVLWCSSAPAGPPDCCHSIYSPKTELCNLAKHTEVWYFFFSSCI